MLTFRRSALLATAVLVVFLLFTGKGHLSPRRLLRDSELEQRLVNNERQMEQALRELEQQSSERAARHDEEIQNLQVQKRILEQQIQELRRLPESASLVQQLAYQFPYNVKGRFPAYIWQTWKTGIDDPTTKEDIRQWMESWTNQNEGFVHEVLPDPAAEQLVKHLYINVPKVVEAYESMPETILKADFFRYLILLARGGAYSDADTEALKPVPNWIPPNVNPLGIGLVVGIEADPDRPDWADWYARRLQFCQWTIQSKPGHPVLRSIVANITEKTLEKKKSGHLPLPGSKDRGSNIMDWTGPGIWTDTVFEYFNKPGLSLGPTDWHNFTGIEEPVEAADVLVLPITSFSPGVGTMGSKEDSDPMAFVKHHFEGSWKPESERM